MLRSNETANVSRVKRNVAAKTRAGIPIQRGRFEMLFAMLVGYTMMDSPWVEPSIPR
jgi:hypothetical protein